MTENIPSQLAALHADSTVAPIDAEPVVAPTEAAKPVEQASQVLTTTETASAAPDAPAQPAAREEAGQTEEAPKTEDATPAPTEAVPEAAPEAAPVVSEKAPEAVETSEKLVAVPEAPATPSGPVWPPIDKDHPLAKFQARLPELLKDAGHNLIWGITLSSEQPIPFHTTFVLQKFLRANLNNVDLAYNQLLGTLKWRKSFNPEAAMTEFFSEEKFGGLGYVTKIKTNEGEKIVTWNIYGACKDAKRTFGDVDNFLRWRIALMELGVKALDLPNATAPIPDYNPTSPNSTIDPYQMIQLHDYQNVSFLRMDSATKAASRKAIQVMASYYPELLSIKFFVNIPFFMTWVFTAMKAILSKETFRKFRVVASGKGVDSELGEEVPKSYGGKGPELAEVGLSPNLVKGTTTEKPENEKKPSKKPSLDKVKEKVVAAIKETKESPTAPTQTVETIPEVNEEEAKAEKADALSTLQEQDNAQAVSSETPAPPNEKSVAADAAAGGATVEVAADGTGCSAVEEPAVTVPTAAEQSETNEEKHQEKESSPLAVVSGGNAIDEEKKTNELDSAAPQTESTTETPALLGA
ncbi:hypothetical protein BDZ91DRAFT_845684 [Kalaharituber pfeilii]|nr:hypothetical protein BDZ91DRAFT_845684 [Kalaharituber pfeilii]